MQTRCCWEVRCSGSSKNRAIIALNAKSVILLPLYRNKTCKTILTRSAIHDTLYRKSHRACRGNAPPSCCARPLCRLKAPLGLSLLRKRGLSEKYRTARIYSPWRFLPPRNTSDQFCRRFTRQNHRCAAWAVFFFSGNLSGQAPPSCCARPFRCLKTHWGFHCYATLANVNRTLKIS